MTAVAELRAVTLAMKTMDRGLRNDIARMTRSTFGPVWQQAIASRARTRQQQAIFGKGARIAGANPPSARAGTSTRKLRGGLVPATTVWAFELGAKDTSRLRTFRRRSVNGTWHTVRARTRAQLPTYSRQGHVVLPAFAELAPRLVSGWVQLVVRRVWNAVEGRN